jgi:two-component system sensor histidine kinase YesM
MRLKDIIFYYFSIKKSIQAKIFVSFMLVTMLALSIVSWYWYSNSSENIKSVTSRNVTDYIVLANNNFETILKDIENYNYAVSMNEPIVLDVITSIYEPPSYEWFGGYQKLKSFLSSFMAYRSNSVSGIGIADLKGNAYTVGDMSIENTEHDQQWRKEILDGQGHTVLVRRAYPAEMETLKKETVISSGRAILRRGQVVGMVLSDLRYDIVQRTFESKNLSNVTVLLIDKNGEIMYESGLKETYAYINDTEYANLYKNLNYNLENISYNVNGEKYLVIPYKSEYTGWTTLALIPQKQVLQGTDQIRNHIISILLIVFCLVFICSMLVSTQITKNLKLLNYNMKKVSEGNFTQLKLSGSQDEVGQLSHFFTIMTDKISEMMKDIERREKKSRTMEIEMLQAQISPHFLYNTLNTIIYLAALQNVQNIREITASLIDLLRISIWNDNLYITLSEELEHAQNYITIQQYKYNHKFTVDYKIDEDVLKYKTIKMILQPVIENSIIHGIEPMQEEGHISISIIKEKDFISLSVTDNGIGMTVEQVNNIFKTKKNKDKLRFSGIGVNNVHERLRLKFGETYGLKVYSQQKLYTTVEIHIPILEGDDEDYA